LAFDLAVEPLLSMSERTISSVRARAAANARLRLLPIFEKFWSFQLEVLVVATVIAVHDDPLLVFLQLEVSRRQHQPKRQQDSLGGLP
jgi:hypothetical protein